MPSRQVRWDAFARQGLKRESHINYYDTDSCAWCGQRPHMLYSYQGTDDRIVSKNPKMFCNLECFDSYNGR